VITDSDIDQGIAMLGAASSKVAAAAATQAAAQ
jgi:hypothetical protein